MTKETVVCDICGKEFSRQEALENVARLDVRMIGSRIRIGNGGGRPMTDSYWDSLKADICCDCLRAKGFHFTGKNEQPIPDPALADNRKTLETKLLDILQDLGVEFQQ